jgi:hypothetical protein
MYVCMYVCMYVNSMSANLRKHWVCKSQIRRVSHLRKVRKSNKLFMSANLRTCDMRNLFADLPLLFSSKGLCNKGRVIFMQFRNFCKGLLNCIDLGSGQQSTSRFCTTSTTLYENIYLLWWKKLGRAVSLLFLRSSHSRPVSRRKKSASSTPSLLSLLKGQQRLISQRLIQIFRLGVLLYWKSASLQRTNTENSKQIFPEKELRDQSPNFHIHVSGSDLHILTIDLLFLLQEVC